MGWCRTPPPPFFSIRLHSSPFIAIRLHSSPFVAILHHSPPSSILPYSLHSFPFVPVSVSACILAGPELRSQIRLPVNRIGFAQKPSLRPVQEYFAGFYLHRHPRISHVRGFRLPACWGAEHPGCGAPRSAAACRGAGHLGQRRW